MCICGCFLGANGIAAPGGAVMFGLLHFAEMQDPLLKHRHPFLVETISAALNDVDTADMFTEILRGMDKWLWFVEVHLQASK